MTNNTDIGGVILYDAACDICSTGARRFQRILARRRFQLLPLQSPRVRELCDASSDELMTEVHVVTPACTVLRGVDALLYVARAIPWARPLCIVARVPGVLPVARVVYRHFAANRYRVARACAIARRDNPLARWLPAAALLVGALSIGRTVPAWGYMWLLALAMFFAAKWITFYPHRRRGSLHRSLLYLFAWTGMDAATFLDRHTLPTRPCTRDWLSATAKAASGFALLVFLPALPLEPLVTAPVGFLALILLLHFGFFHLLALLYRSVGIDAQPLMNHPMHSRSLAEFWGRRWNSGFNALVDQTLFAPMRRPFGAVQATMMVFLVSGVIHDVILSLPARGGYGLPTLYFLIQLLGLLIERTRPMRRITRSPLGKIYTAAFTVLPLPLLFHEPFLRNVMLPFLHAIGALP